MQQHPIGTEIYYAGDIANPSGFGKIVRLDQSPRFGTTYDIELEDGRELRGIPTILVGDKYEGHHGHRFVTREAYDAYWKEAQTPKWFHNIKHMTLDNEGYLRWKDHVIERLDPEIAQSHAFRGKARILEARCKRLEAQGKDVNKFSVVLNWPEPAGRGR
jgi:hypothetical protein